MSDLKNAAAIQGADPKSVVFGDVYPILYAAEGPISGSYEIQSYTSCVCAETLGRLRAMRVLDLGCGFGTTTAHIVRFFPKQVVAVDSSASMTALMSVIMVQDLDLEEFCRARGAEPILGELFYGTIQYLKRRRMEFRESNFNTDGGTLEIRTQGLFEISQESLGAFDAVIANNMLHWPIGQKKIDLKKQEECRAMSEKELTRRAAIEALSKIRTLLPYEGLAVIMEPQDFVYFERDREREAQCERRASTANPVFQKFNEIFNRRLKEQFGIERAVPKRNPLFPFEEFGDWCLEAGFDCRSVVQIESVKACDSILWCYVRMPLWLGSVNISFDDKMRLTKEVLEEARRTITSEELQAPMISQGFYFCLTAI